LTQRIPSEVSFYDTSGYTQGLVVVGGKAYLADGRSGLGVLDVSDPSNPFEISYYDTPGVAEGVVVTGSYILVTDGSAGLIILKYTRVQDDSLTTNIID
jgi:hypothetical protein